MVCASVREDNLRPLASCVSPVQTQSHTKTIFALLCIVRYWTLNIGISMKGAIMYFLWLKSHL